MTQEQCLDFIALDPPEMVAVLKILESSIPHTRAQLGLEISLLLLTT